MASLHPDEGSSTSGVSGGSSELTQLNIKTLDSRIYTIHVDKNTTVSTFKEKIAGQCGVPVGQQRLIFRGKVLKDDYPLCEYNVEDGDTLHLIQRQPQPSPGSRSINGESTSRNTGQNPATGGLRNRIRHVSHSIVVGTLNAGEPGESDMSQVIGAVLNSVGIGNLAGGVQPVQTSQGNDTQRPLGNAGGQGGNLFAPWQALNSQGAAMPVPTLNMTIPDSVSTLTEFMNRMELAFSQNAGNINVPAAELPANFHGLSTIEDLSTVLRHAQRLLSSHVSPALSHIAGRLDQEGVSNNPEVRGQVHRESIQLGISMQHLGALLLELGRTTLTLRMGQSPAESYVNAGPAVYINPSGPNPIMVQPFPHQTSSLFGGPSGVSLNPVALGPIGVGSVARNVNIHIHTGASLAPRMGNRPSNGEGIQGQHVNGVPESGNSGATSTPPGIVSQAPESNSVSPFGADVNAYLGNLVNEHNPTSGDFGRDDMSSQLRDFPSGGIDETNLNRPEVTMTDDQKAQTMSPQPKHVQETGVDKKSNVESCTGSEGFYNRSSASELVENLELPLRSNQSNDSLNTSSAAPLGLGLGGLQLKGRVRQTKSQSMNSDDATTTSQDQQSRAVGQHILQALASNSTGQNVNSNAVTSDSDGQSDVADAMSQVLQSPALDGLLNGMSQQTGVGSPDMLRSILHQFTQNPATMNMVNQIAQQIDGRHDLGSMFSDSDRGQGGGINLSQMMQQMMPIVSQALGGVSSAPRLTPSVEPFLSESRSRRDVPLVNTDPQIDLGQVVEKLKTQSSPEEIFVSMVDTAATLSSGDSAGEGVLNELSINGGLAKEFVEMLCLDISRRLQEGRGS